MDSVNYILLYEGNSKQGGHEASVRSFARLKAARAAMDASYREFAGLLNIPISPKSFDDQYTVRTRDSISLKRYGDRFQWKIIKAVPEDAADAPSGSAVLRVTGDRHIPLMSALLELCVKQPKLLDRLVEVIPYDDEDLCISEVRLLRPPYLRALNDISQLLQNNGYEAASKFLDCSFEL